MEAVQQTARAGQGAGALAHRLCDRLARGVHALVLVLAAAMLLALSLQVVMRYAFDRAPSWTEEFAITCFGWSMLLAIAVGVRDAIHVRMDLLVDRLPQPLRRGLDKAVSVATGLIGLFIAWHGARYVADTAGATSAAIGYPIAWLYACAPVCGGLIALFAFERAFACSAAQPD